ncbi:unknown protein [Microcystis aeruginosa NIES-843]|uniref:Uncharacterized protein n=1 Tax=Microcystis aeruginosa (strain NIES-843 / IAM M-2473) TaxID=449447 RepID=B0JHC5_MICAN|nr:unknown protein [Microcystis aeruginosa NIES-843]
MVKLRLELRRQSGNFYLIKKRWLSESLGEKCSPRHIMHGSFHRWQLKQEA